jgi:hypothetical protein
MIRINVQTVKSGEHRYPTIGDYWTDADGVEQVRVTEMSDWHYEVLVVIHEIVESYLCKHAKIDEPVIKSFDERFEDERRRWMHPISAEPGFDKRAPYREQHTIATAIEMMLAAMLGVDWAEYEKEQISK